jgi:peroxiredoxin
MVLITRNNEALAIGAPMPEFEVTVTSGAKVSPRTLLGSGRKGAVIVISCNHCPYAKAYDGRAFALARETAPKGIAWLAVNPNAANPTYPEDSFEAMKRIVKNGKIPFPYAADTDQSLARAFGAACTPEFYLFDAGGTLRYAGRLDDEMEEAKVKTHHLRDAIDDLLAGRSVRTPHSHPIGCSIKWI